MPWYPPARGVKIKRCTKKVSLQFKWRVVTDNVTCFSHLVDTGYFESKGASVMTGSVHVVSEHQDQVEQFFEVLGILQSLGGVCNGRN